MDEPSTTGAPAAGTLRRLGALAYDALLLLALLFVATLPWLPMTHGEAITPQASGWVSQLYRAWLLLVAFGYFGLSWTRGGQTLGMRAWRIGLERADGGVPGWLDALVRFTLGAAMALLAGLGLWFLRGPGWSLPDFAAALLLLPPCANLLWAACDARGRSLQDIASDTRVVRR
ncbi:MAG TPA: RDD family protein [Steroidobacteraceae bacterium]|nr:RDD family protein [Steroidobacteraceae bacterium]